MSNAAVDWVDPVSANEILALQGGAEIKRQIAEFDPLMLGQVLRDELTELRSAVTDECYATVLGVAAVLLGKGAADFMLRLPKITPAGAPIEKRASLQVIEGGK